MGVLHDIALTVGTGVLVVVAAGLLQLAAVWVIDTLVRLVQAQGFPDSVGGEPTEGDHTMIATTTGYHALPVEHDGRGLRGRDFADVEAAATWAERQCRINHALAYVALSTTVVTGGVPTRIPLGIVERTQSGADVQFDIISGRREVW